MKKLIYKTFALLLTLSVVLVSCEDDRPEAPGGISGIVTNSATNAPLGGVNVLLSTGATVVTGSNGFFQFSQLPAGEYTLTFTRTGFGELREHVVTVRAGEITPGSVSLDMLPPALRIVSSTNPPVDIDSLDFGSADADVTRSFNIFNDGPESLEWEITYPAPWVTAVSRTGGTLSSLGVQAIVVTIDRAKLSGGDNITTIHVTSDNGSKDLVVRATGRMLATLNTHSVTNITSTAATFNGEILNPGFPIYTERGFVFSTSPTPTLENTIERLTVPLTESRMYSASVTGLTFGETYFVRAFAVNSEGIAFGNEVSFTPISSAPTLTTQAVTSINIANGTAIFNGTIESVGDPAYTERGFVFGTTPNPTSADRKVIAAGSGVTSTFSLLVDEIQEGFVYYVRAFAINASGTEYGNQISFSFIAEMPTVTTQPVTNISVANGTARFSGTIVSAGDLPILERGFVLGTMPNPTSADIKIRVPGTAIGAFDLNVANIEEGAIYFVRAFATNTTGTIYSHNEESFTFVMMPTVTMRSVTNVNINAGTAVFNATVVSASNLPIIERGFVFGSIFDTDIHNATRIAVLGTNADYSSTVTNIPRGYYFVRAYVTNAIKTIYSEDEIRMNFSSEGCNTNTPAFGNNLGTVSFLTNRTWTIGNQTWSDAVTATACQKNVFSGGSSGNFNADCRTNPGEGSGNFFSFCAVTRFQDRLCPYPWRVPTRDDFRNLDIALGGTGNNRNTTAQFVTNNYINLWGGAFGLNAGFWPSTSASAPAPARIPGTVIRTGFYWSRSGHYFVAGSGTALTFNATGTVHPQGSSGKENGLLLRCVRNN